MAPKAKRSTQKPEPAENTRKEILGQSTQVVLNMEMLRNAGKKYDPAVDIISRCHRERVINKEMYIQRYVGDDDYLCSFQFGKIRQEVKVPASCFSSVVPSEARHAVSPSARLTKPLRFPVSAAERVVAKRADF